MLEHGASSVPQVAGEYPEGYRIVQVTEPWKAGDLWRPVGRAVSISFWLFVPSEVWGITPSSLSFSTPEGFEPEPFETIRNARVIVADKLRVTDGLHAV